MIAGDIITEIDGSPVAGLTLDPVLARLRGAPGTSVRLSSPTRKSPSCAS